LHTANAETVNYIIARSDILSTLGTVIALFMFARGGLARRWHLYTIPAAAAVLAKEQGVMAPPLLMLYAGLCEQGMAVGDLFRPRHVARLLRDPWPSIVACGIVALVGLTLGSSFEPGGSSRWEYLITQPFVVLHYALAFVLPLNLSADTDWKPIANLF